MKDYIQLIKFRLTFTVVLSAALGYLIGIYSEDLPFNWVDFLALVCGGFLIVSGSNGLNQVIEKDYDKLMQRTQNRPVATKRMSVTEAVIFSSVVGLLGVFLLGYFINQVSAYLGLFALVSYAFFYTPLKRITPLAVLVGAFPGAVPPLLGWIAATGKYSLEGGLLFAIQFFWQFPHFWAIAWVLHEDYQKAGYLLLPSREGRTKGSAFHTVLYTLFLSLISVTPVVFGLVNVWALTVLIPLNIYFLWKANNLFKTLGEKEAKSLMYASFLYLPLAQIALIIFQ